ncbi:MAG: DUF3006 domain-containing protein [Oscillospiraceae bacterium]|nr:DUF3006 domain-containing protein [Oscillospiraceae bacterium]
MLVIDRIEDGIAVIEEGDSRFEVPVSMLDGNVREGDVVTLENGVYVPDISATEKRRREILNLQNDLWE